MLRNIATIIILLVTVLPESQAQKETSVWYFGRGIGLDFSTSTPLVLYDGANFGNETAATVSDANGQLLFYTNGETIWNRHHVVMENGEGLVGNSSSRQGAVIVPDPNRQDGYYLFTVDEAPGNSIADNQGLHYHYIDMLLGDSLGVVTTKNLLLGKPTGEGLTAVIGCDCGGESNYWILTGDASAPGSILAYQLGSTGVKPQPVISGYAGDGRIHFIEASPDRQYVSFLEYRPEKEPQFRAWKGSFNPSTGTVNEVTQIASSEELSYFSSLAFSPSGKYLYLSNGVTELSQYVTSSGLKVNQKPHGPVNMHLTPNGEIYFFPGISSSIGSITKPDETGLESVEEKIMVAPDTVNNNSRFTYSFANFPASYFYSGTQAFAGTDTTICSGEQVVLGDHSKGLQYEWTPKMYLNDPFSPNPVFTFDNYSDTVQLFTYILTATDNYCTRCDTVKISVLPGPKKEIIGKRSVCPGSDHLYEIDSVPGYFYQWAIEGGTIIGDSDSATVSANWGPATDNAEVTVTLANEYGCPEESLTLAIKVNVELVTETPWGNIAICEANAFGQMYQVLAANQSVYTWSASGGTILSGQTTASAEVNWSGVGTHRISVREQSITSDTVCFGQSEELVVEVISDTITLALNYISVDTVNSSAIHGEWSTNNVDGLIGPVSLWRRTEGQQEWELIQLLDTSQGIFNDPFARPSEAVYEYKVTALNWCDRQVESVSHSNMLLGYQKSSDESFVDLTYTAYLGWDTPSSRYQLFSKNENTALFSYQGENNELSDGFYHFSGLDAFQYSFRVKAIDDDRGYDSWSNTVHVEFIHDIEAPNVFTPNGDGFNESFFIKKIHLFPENEFSVFDRNGKMIYQTTNYSGEWSGESLDAGVYYYTLRILKNKKTITGWIHILK